MKYLSAIQPDGLVDKTIVMRIDCDVDMVDEGGRLKVDEDYRLRCVLPTINFLIDHRVRKIVMLGHVGRPEGRVVKELELEPVARWLVSHLYNAKIKNQKSKIQGKIQKYEGYEITDKIVLLENIRFDKREEENDEGFAKELGGLGDVYVNEVFGVSHRDHASITGIPKYLPSFYGLQFEKEIARLTWLKKDAPRPLVFVLGGSKVDKLEYLNFLGSWTDTVLIGGKLPTLIQSTNIEYRNPKEIQISNNKIPSNGLLDKQNNARSIVVSQYPGIKLATLTQNGLDISQDSVEEFKDVIAKAATVVWAGPMGKYEEEGNEVGTYEIARSVAKCAGIKFAGGGDTHRIISRLSLWDKFDFVSVGGGAMLRLLADTKM